MGEVLKLPDGAAACECSCKRQGTGEQRVSRAWMRGLENRKLYQVERYVCIQLYNWEFSHPGELAVEACG